MEIFKYSSDLAHRLREGIMNIKFSPMYFTDKRIEVDIHIHIVDLLHCTAETNTAL